jgi:hypothetical protein
MAAKVKDFAPPCPAPLHLKKIRFSEGVSDRRIAFVAGGSGSGIKLSVNNFDQPMCRGSDAQEFCTAIPPPLSRVFLSWHGCTLDQRAHLLTVWKIGEFGAI